MMRKHSSSPRLGFKLHEEGGMLVCIEAVCINQDDLEERNSQVQRMLLIYS